MEHWLENQLSNPPIRKLYKTQYSKETFEELVNTSLQNAHSNLCSMSIVELKEYTNSKEHTKSTYDFIIKFSWYFISSISNRCFFHVANNCNMFVIVLYFYCGIEW